MAELTSASGAEFDRLFLQQMIVHHQGAIDMADTEIAQGSNTAALTLAESIEDQPGRGDRRHAAAAAVQVVGEMAGRPSGRSATTSRSSAGQRDPTLQRITGNSRTVSRRPPYPLMSRPVQHQTRAPQHHNIRSGATGRRPHHQGDRSNGNCHQHRAVRRQERHECERHGDLQRQLEPVRPADQPAVQRKCPVDRQRHRPGRRQRRIGDDPIFTGLVFFPIPVISSNGQAVTARTKSFTFAFTNLNEDGSLRRRTTTTRSALSSR